MTRETLTAARWPGRIPGKIYRRLLDTNDANDALYLQQMRSQPDFAAVTVEIDFSPATSPALNRPVRSEVEAERDRLRALLREARDYLDGLAQTKYKFDLPARIDAALSQQSAEDAA